LPYYSNGGYKDSASTPLTQGRVLRCARIVCASYTYVSRTCLIPSTHANFIPPFTPDSVDHAVLEEASRAVIKSASQNPAHDLHSTVLQIAAVSCLQIRRFPAHRSRTRQRHISERTCAASGAACAPPRATGRAPRSSPCPPASRREESCGKPCSKTSCGVPSSL
jgi:hypothetical protein